MPKRYLTPAEIQELMEASDSDDSIDDTDSDPDYVANDSEMDKNDFDESEHMVTESRDYSEKDELMNDSSEDEELTNDSFDNHLILPNIGTSNDDNVLWTSKTDSFQSRFQTPENPLPGIIIHPDIHRGSSELNIFLKHFPQSLFIHIADSTNKRLDIFDQEKHKKTKPTDMGEVMVLVGCTLIMHYNKLPSTSSYWANEKSLGNAAIKDAISRDRFCLLSSKLYFADPEKPPDCGKLYYIEDVLRCLKKTFREVRSDSEAQSIDESMTKFKGRSSLKQYMPMKPVKRGIKIWQRCDSLTGYVYDLNVYACKDIGSTKNTLGERVVYNLVDTSANVTLFFDCFFTSVKLMDTLKYAAVGTCIKTRKNMPKLNLQSALEKSESVFRVNGNGTLWVQWKDTKDVMLLSNCHFDKVVTAERKRKDGTKVQVPCPEAIYHYNKYMNGVDRCDQMATLYGHGRKSDKWWKKVFWKLVMISVVNSWIVKCEVDHKKVPLLTFMVSLAEQLITHGRSKTEMKRTRKCIRPSKKAKDMINVGDHLPIQQAHRKRCCRCSARKLETRTYTICQMCQVALCKNCFTPYHT